MWFHLICIILSPMCDLHFSSCVINRSHLKHPTKIPQLYLSVLNSHNLKMLSSHLHKISSPSRSCVSVCSWYDPHFGMMNRCAGVRPTRTSSNHQASSNFEAFVVTRAFVRRSESMWGHIPSRSRMLIEALRNAV